MDFENSVAVSIELSRLSRRLFHFLSRSSPFFPLPVRHSRSEFGMGASSRLSPRFTRAIANLFRRVGDGVGRNRSTLYSSRIDRQPRARIWKHYIFSRRTSWLLFGGPLVNKASTFLARSFIISLPGDSPSSPLARLSRPTPVVAPSVALRDLSRIMGQVG